MLKLFHRDLGGEGKPPLVVLHGMLGSSRNWQTAGRDLSADFHVLAPDLRNHGASPSDGEITYEAMAGDVLNWLDRLALADVALVGHSMGGKVAMLLACRNPERVNRLVAVDIAPRDYSWSDRRAEIAALSEIDLGSLKSRADAEARLAARIPNLALRKFLLTNLERGDVGGWRWAVDLPALTRSLPAIERNPLSPGDSFAGPSLFITGGRSHYVGVQDQPAIIQHFPNARIEVIAESGHNPHMDARGKFVELITRRPRPGLP